MSKVVYSRGDTCIVAHMHWSPYLAQKRDRAVIRKTSKMVSGVRYVIDEEGEDKQIGFESADPFAVSGKKAKKRSSFALLCREYLLDLAESNHLGHQNGIFVMPMADDSDKRAVCAIRDGSIVQDTVEQRSRAFTLAEERHREMAGYCVVISEEDELPIQLTQAATWEDLAANITKANLLAPVPASPFVPVALLAVVAAVGGATAYYFLVQQPAMEAERARKLAAADKTPEYINALRAAAQDAGWEREALIATIDSLKARPYFIAGWSLDKLECDKSRCLETWQRQGGTLDELVTALPDATLVADKELNKDVALMERVPALAKPQSLNVDQLPAGPLEVQVLLKPTVQVLDSAGIKVKVDKPQVWPKMPLNGIKKTALVMAHPIELESKYPVSMEALSKLPPNVAFNGFAMTSSDPKSFVITVKGNAYVR